MSAPHPFQNLIISFSPGERIFTEGEVGTTMFIVQSGRVRLFHEADGTPMPIAEMEKGDFFGEMSLLEAIPRNMSAEAIDSTELIEINSTTFDRMIRSNIEIAVRMLRKLSGRLQKTEAQIASLKRTHAEEASHQAAAPPRAPARPAAPAPAPAVQAARPPASAPPPRPQKPPATTGYTMSGQPPVAPFSQAARSVTTQTPAAPKPGPPPQASASTSGSLSATRPPSRTMQGTAPRAAAPASGSVRIFPARPAAGEGPRLVSETGETIFPLAAPEALLGRYDPVTETQPEVDLTLIDIKRSVSRRHARITLRDGGYFLVEEVGALNGTFINGVKMVTGQPSPLKDNDRVSVGTVHLVFRI